jgi:1-acyl-sn-glycerol-3-phosphate acyltransferase
MPMGASSGKARIEEQIRTLPTVAEPMSPEERSRVFWTATTPAHRARIERHNRRIGTGLQRFVEQLLSLYVVAPLVFVLLSLLFRVRVIGKERIAQSGGRAIFAVRHFYEWDPFFTFGIILFPRAFLRPSEKPLYLAGHHWTRSRFWRFLSYLFGIVGVSRGEGPKQGAMARAAALLGGRRRVSVAIFPTGPIGRAPYYDVRPGVGYLATLQPDAPILPVTVMGLQHLSWRDVLRLRRPRICIALGEPIYGRDCPAEESERAAAVCLRVREAWTADETKLRAWVEDSATVPAPARVETQSEES